jgi:cyclic lactone autoinducer peptide
METVRVKTSKKRRVLLKMKKRNWMYRLSSKSMSVMAALALMVTTMATNRSCMWYLGQDKMPEDSKKLRRF